MEMAKGRRNHCTCHLRSCDDSSISMESTFSEALRLGKAHHTCSGSVFIGEWDLSFRLLCGGKDGEEGRVKDVEREKTRGTSMFPS